MNVIITGAAGYIGTMLIERFAHSSSIETIYGIDLRAPPARFVHSDKVRWVQADVADHAWTSQVDGKAIHVVIHCAYQIRELYGSKKKPVEH